MPAQQPLRSALYVPGANARALEKARALAADAVLLDLEDAVAPAAKETARAQVVAALAAGGWRAQRVVRVNGAGTPWHADDLSAVARAAGRRGLPPQGGGARGGARRRSGARGGPGRRPARRSGP